MTTAAGLRAAADQAARDALAAIDAAADLERHHALLEHRLTPVIDRHTSDVWSSRAANASRLRLQLGANANLTRARAAVLDVANEVRRRAVVLETLASDYRREAVRLEALAAESAGPEPAPIPPPLGVR